MEIQGHCDERFGAVRDAFAANFAQGAELGASAAVTIDGVLVVDIWGGDADEAGNPWRENTIVNVYSTTKTMAALCMLMLSDRGELDFAAPVARYWPEFAQNGKEKVLVSHIMSHSSGLSGWDEPLQAEDLYDWDRVTGLLAAQEPWWEPASAPGYHAVSQGFLQGEILRRITGETMDSFFRREVSEPLGADFHISLDEEHDSRVGDLIPPVGLEEMAADIDPQSIAYRTLMNPTVTALEPRTREWRAAEIPAAGGFGNARSVARVHSAIACGGSVDGVSLLRPESVEIAVEEQIRGMDLVTQIEARFGMGYGLGTAAMPLTDRMFYWGGWGGSLALIDLDQRMTISYVMNKMAIDMLGDTRGASIALAAAGAAATA
ncbi:MAG: serine hydrolase domain-containing protein [Acidimicrobiales bacterium]